MAKRMRRFVITTPAITGARDFSHEDSSEYNRDRADDEGAGDEVRMSNGPYPIRFELLAEDPACVSGYLETLVVVGKEITRSGGSESSADKTYTYGQGHLTVGGDMPTDTPGRIPVAGEFKTRTKT